MHQIQAIFNRQLIEPACSCWLPRTWRGSSDFLAARVRLAVADAVRLAQEGGRLSYGVEWPNPEFTPLVHT